MKKLILFAAFLWASAPLLKAQSTVAPTVVTDEQKNGTPGKSPAERASKDADWAEKKLGLNSDQKAKWREASLVRINANEPLRGKMKASTDQSEKRSFGMQMRDNSKKFEETVNGFLTADQKTKWEQARQERKEQRKHKMKKGTIQPAPGMQD